MFELNNFVITVTLSIPLFRVWESRDRNLLHKDWLNTRLTKRGCPSAIFLISHLSNTYKIYQNSDESNMWTRPIQCVSRANQLCTWWVLGENWVKVDRLYFCMGNGVTPVRRRNRAVPFLTSCYLISSVWHSNCISISYWWLTSSFVWHKVVWLFHT